MTDLSPEQQTIVGLPLEPLCVTACAGSGKTRTATRRLWEMRQKLDDKHGIIALLSFSNVAVDTFRRDYYGLRCARAGSFRSTAVEIDTVDGFLTRNILRPHAHRTMGASRTAFLIRGREPFLKSFTVYDGKRPQPTADLRVSLA
jgi:superfamily I DNA/RNA helicase